MDHDVRAVAPGDDAAQASERLAETGAGGLPVLGPGLAEPGYLDRRDLLAALARRLPLPA